MAIGLGSTVREIIDEINKFNSSSDTSGGSNAGETLAIEVEELPTENIDDSKIYILNRQGKNAEVYLHSGTEYFALSALSAQAGGAAYYYIVDELPTVGELSDVNNNIMHCYIFNDIPYIYVDLGDGASWTTISAYMGGSFPDKGVTENIANETEMGVYVFYTTANIISKSFYLYNNNQWEKLNNAIVDVTELPTENADKNVIYRLTKADFYSPSLGILPEPYVCNVVNELPSVGNPIQYSDGNSIDSSLEVYYVPSENKIYGYVDENLSQHHANIGETYEVGWYSANEYLGSDIKIIFDTAEATEQALYLLVQCGFYVYAIGGLTQINGGEIDTTKDYSWTGKNTFRGRTNFLDIVWFGDPDDIIRPDIKFYPNSVSFMKTGIDMGNVSFSSKVSFSDEVDFSGATITGLPEPDLSTLVTLDTEQTITGDKTFEGEVDFTNATVTGLPISSDASAGGITELTTQSVRITDLEDGIYKWVYDGEKTLYYYGETAINNTSVSEGSQILLIYGTRETSSSPLDYYKRWILFGEYNYTGTNKETFCIRYGITSVQRGTYTVKCLDYIPSSPAMTLSDVQTVTGDKTFTGAVDFTNATVTGLSSGNTSGSSIDTSADITWEGDHEFNGVNTFNSDVTFNGDKTLFANGATFNGELDFTTASIFGFPDFVTPDTKQTITGNKTFTGNVDFSNATVTGLPTTNTETLTAITYSELKALRDTNQLVPGMLYRITDYACTTTQENTRAMDNKFDIIVQAFSKNVLSETAFATLHENEVTSDDGTLNFIDDVIYSKSGNGADQVWTGDDALVQGSVIPYYYIYEDVDGPGSEAPTEYKPMDGFVAYGYAENDEGVTVPVIYKTDVESAVDAPEEFGYPDYGDVFFYIGRESIEGVEYDKWRKIAVDSDNDPKWDSVGKVYLYTNVIIQNGSTTTTTDSYFATSKLSAWELKYCLDNDKTRFAWADENNGKGVIYYMKDEHGNECPYDFKNIQFNRDNTWQEEHTEFIEGLGISVGDVSWFYTFSWINENLEVEDLSIRQDLMSDEGTAYGTHNNKIKSYYIAGENGPKKELNNIIIINSYQYESDIFYGCYNNTFGTGCSNNVFGNDCYDNIFGYECDSNIFKSSCHNNTFGNHCSSNTFGYGCYNNTFGNNCYDNTFSYTCHNNTFGINCSHIIFENNCYGNTFETNIDRCQLAERSCRVRVCQGVVGTIENTLVLTPEPNSSTQTIYRKSGTKEIIID